MGKKEAKEAKRWLDVASHGENIHDERAAEVEKYRIAMYDAGKSANQTEGTVEAELAKYAVDMQQEAEFARRIAQKKRLLNLVQKTCASFEKVYKHRLKVIEDVS